MDTMAEIRSEAISAMGLESTIDAIAVSALFQLMNRVANGTGTPVDDFMVAPANAVSAQIGADEFHSRDETPMPPSA